MLPLKGLEFLSGCSLDHVGIAVVNLDASIKCYESIGLKFDSHREIVDDQKVTVAFAPMDQNARLELIASTTEDGPIAKFIESKGAGIHHLCFLVDDLRQKQAELEKKGMKFVYKEAKVGANQRLINFIHPKSTGGVLIELSQKIND